MSSRSSNSPYARVPVALDPSVRPLLLTILQPASILTPTQASADRRPVDPPPIVQLRVFEAKPNVTGEDTLEDITFMMNANYFLFATLEPARHMAQPRGMPDPNKPTVCWHGILGPP